MPPEETSRRAVDEAIINMSVDIGSMKEHIKNVDNKVSAIDLKCIDLNGYKQRIISCEARLHRHDKIIDKTAYILIVIVGLGMLGFLAVDIYKRVHGG